MARHGSPRRLAADEKGVNSVEGIAAPQVQSVSVISARGFYKLMAR